MGATHEGASFYENVGLAFDEICKLGNVEVFEKTKVAGNSATSQNAGLRILDLSNL